MNIKNLFSFNRFRAYSILLLVITILFCLAIPYVNGQDKINISTKRILFAGNSYTFFENMPHVVSAMAEKKGISLTTHTSTAGGATLENHWKGEKNLKTMQMIKTGDYDAVVLQDQSLRPILEPEKTLRDIELFCRHIRESGAIPYLYLTWSRGKSPETQEDLNKIFFQAASVNDARVVPVGPAWKLARKSRPDIQLYRADGSHPSKLGAYLTACVFFGALTGENPEGLTNEPIMTDKSGKPVTIMRINQQDAEFCQRVARQAIDIYL